jgi:hypothetical protein
MIICGPVALNEQGESVMDALGIEAYGQSPYSHTFLHASEKVSKGLAE